MPNTKKIIGTQNFSSIINILAHNKNSHNGKFMGILSDYPLTKGKKKWHTLSTPAWHGYGNSNFGNCK
jgi:hypothetical protein